MSIAGTRRAPADLDIAVVGAGMAGLYAAWRLLSSGAGPGRIGLFEADSRLGGRVLTVRAPQDETFAIDLGAHSYSSTHGIVGELVGRRFGLKAAPCIGQAPTTMVNLRGRTLTNAEVRRSWFLKPFRYDVSARLQRRGPARLLRKALSKMPRDDSGHRRLGGRPLAEWALDDAMAQVLAPDELRHLSDRLSYTFWNTPLNAEAVLDWTARETFRSGQAMWALPGGMAQLPEALAQAVRDLGGRIELHHRLSGLDLGEADTVPLTLRFETKDGGYRSITASRVILALPPAGLARVKGLADLAEFRSLIAALAPQRAVTTALIYPEAWWRRAGVAAGYSVTDQPARHIRHYGSEAWRKPGPGALLSYSDGGFADFWTKLADGGGGFGWIGPEHPIVRELHRQAAAMFEARRDLQPPPPIAGFSHDWANDLSGAAFHLWQAGSRPERTSVEALDPLPGRPLHICGEAWSIRQGWIEGALETVAMLLERLPGTQAAQR